MAEKMKCSRGMVAQQRGQATCTEQRWRTEQSSEANVPGELRRDTGLHDPKAYYGSR
jgi:hypothetical protein